MLAVIPIDLQAGFVDEAHWGGERNNPDLEGNVTALLAAARTHRIPIFHVKHNSTEPESPLRPEHSGNAFMPEAEPEDDEPVFEKTVNAPFFDTNLESVLREGGFTDLIMFGMTTEHCLSTSVRVAANLGFHVTVVADACAAFPKRDLTGRVWSADDVHHAHLASLQDEFAQITDSATIMKSME